MKESEAKTKSCPYLWPTKLIMLTANASNINARDILNSPVGNCAGSNCMMWEPDWNYEGKEISKDDEIPEGWHDPTPGHTYLNKKRIRRYVPMDTGDCGLKNKGGCHE